MVLSRWIIMKKNNYVSRSVLLELEKEYSNIECFESKFLKYQVISLLQGPHHTTVITQPAKLILSELFWFVNALTLPPESRDWSLLLGLN